ncbi:SRPBCC family protein [Micromonospora radicis]|uniref:SRPBCC family protein n=1 Tax=Micromonospora radicis TaxID=1894971 RepID=A0A418MNL4_9ACTN|nr:SRPBCC family protein [Micromonospora radicis]RIV32633.1 SRPBCC family protein [Micromonospora radicis]
MSTVAVRAVVAAPADELWRVLTDLPRRLPADGPVEVLTPGPFGPGTAWRGTRLRPDGSAWAEHFVVLVAEPPRRLVLSSPGDDVDYLITWTLRDARRFRRRATAVTVTVRARPAAPAGRALALLLGGLAARAAEKVLRRDLAALAAAAADRAA